MPQNEKDWLKRSSRDPKAIGARLQAWLREVTGDGHATVDSVTSPESTGMSSETLLFDARVDGEARRLVARVAPDLADVPVFPTYDLAAQYRVIRLVGEHTDVPVPITRWLELDEGPLGAPFFVMDRVDGDTTPDLPPYTFEGWLLDADETLQLELEQNAVGILASVHSIDIGSIDSSFLELDRPGETPLERHIAEWDAYHEWTSEERVHPILQDGRRWLEENWPEETEPVVSWGDSRIGNVLWRGSQPLAVLDWEMAGVGPRELDLGWMLFFHQFFQQIAERFEQPGLPDFMNHDRVIDLYSQASGIEPVDLYWYETYAAWRHGIIMARIFARTVHFGTAEWPDDIDTAIVHCDQIAEMISR